VYQGLQKRKIRGDGGILPETFREKREKKKEHIKSLRGGPDEMNVKSPFGNKL